MSDDKPATEPTTSKTDKTGQPADDSQPRTELDGKNDSGPEPEIHGRDIPPQ